MLFRRKRSEATKNKEEDGRKNNEEEKRHRHYKGGTRFQVGVNLAESSNTTVRGYSEEGYSLGPFEYSRVEINKIEINWHIGNVTLIESENKVLSCKEEGTALSPEATMRHFIDKEGVLHIEFGAPKTTLYFKDWRDKNLTIEVPPHIDLQIDNSSGDIFSESLNDREINFSTASGEIDIDSVRGDTLNVSTSSGDVALDRTKVDELRVAVSSGDVSLSSLKADSHV